MNKNKLRMFILIFRIIVILTIGGTVINQIYKNYQANTLITEECFNDFDEEKAVVVIKSDDLLSLVSCE
ncbi:hypothetical protein IEO70_00715 [Bacillus sp. AGMB 02131]|uniref:Uncharacterized protein n=1 Tax=Peribacillus faecalis TaxID=2772559 RepID=A0A927H9H6_9BACI|nr:hypothetical protein [Peribacillus faecalis]MBD3106899.1 hypothetical protein [Peribacillus faecalis]